MSKSEIFTKNNKYDTTVKKNKLFISRSADKLEFSTSTASQTPGVILESSTVYKLIYPNLSDNSSENESDSVDETDDANRKKYDISNGFILG